MESLKLICGTFLLALCLSLTARDKDVVYGKIDVADLEVDVCPIDSNAKAYYIYDQGVTDFVYNHGYQLNLIR